MAWKISYIDLQDEFYKIIRSYTNMKSEIAFTNMLILQMVYSTHCKGLHNLELAYNYNKDQIPPTIKFCTLIVPIGCQNCHQPRKGVRKSILTHTSSNLFFVETHLDFWGSFSLVCT